MCVCLPTTLAVDAYRGIVLVLHRGIVLVEYRGIVLVLHRGIVLVERLEVIHARKLSWRYTLS